MDDISISIVEEPIKLFFPDLGVQVALTAPTEEGSGGGPGGGVTDHGALGGLSDDDHPQYLNNARGDARYSALGHTHPEYADFTYNIAITGDVAQIGGTYNGDGTVTLPFLSNLGLPTGATVKVLLKESPDDAFDGGYSYTKLASGDDWIMDRFDSPFQLQNIGKIVSVGYGFTEQDAILGLLFFSGTWSIRAVSWAGHTHDTDHNHDSDYASIDHDHEGLPVYDPRRWNQDWLWKLWRAIPYKLRTMPTAASMENGYDACWKILNDTTGTGTLPYTPTGVDIRAFFLCHAPYRDDEVLDPMRAYPFQRFRELITQPKWEATGGDLSEWALRHNDTTSPNAANGTADWFWEATLEGAPGEQFVVFNDGAENISVPVLARLTQETAPDPDAPGAVGTVTFWRAIPYDTGEPGIQTTDDGITWFPLFSHTDARWASMREDVDPLPWMLGIQNNADYAWMTMHEFAGSKILDIRPNHVAAAFGATSFVDGVGNTISTIEGLVVKEPEFALVDHNHAGVYALVGHTHDGYATADDVNTAYGAALAYTDLRVPSPAAQPNDKWLKTQAGFLVYTDPPAGGASLPSNPVARVSGFAQRDWTIPGVIGVSSTGTTPSQFRPNYAPIRLEQERTFDRLAVEVTTPFSAGSLVRAAIYNVDQFWQPTSLILDCGQLPADPGSVPTLQQAVINLTLQPGNYMVIVVCNGTGGQLRSHLCYSPDPVALGDTGAAQFRGKGTLSSFNSSNNYATAGFPSSGVNQWERDLIQAAATTGYLFKMREVV